MVLLHIWNLMDMDFLYHAWCYNIMSKILILPSLLVTKGRAYVLCRLIFRPTNVRANPSFEMPVR